MTGVELKAALDGGEVPASSGQPGARPAVEDVHGERFATAFLVVANLVPLVGVFGFGWDAGSIVLLYWCENLVAGFYTVLRMATAQGPGALKTFMIPFFIVHYGMFCSVHGVFVARLFHLDGGRHGFMWPPDLVATALRMPGMSWSLAGLFLSHGVSFVENHFVRGGWRKTALPNLMMRPYGRMVVLHVAILAGGFVLVSTGAPVALLPVLVLAKLALDLRAHRRASRRMI